MYSSVRMGRCMIYPTHTCATYVCVHTVHTATRLPSSPPLSSSPFHPSPPLFSPLIPFLPLSSPPSPPFPSPPFPSPPFPSPPFPSPLLTFNAGSHFLQEVPWGWRYHPIQCHGDLTVVLATTSVPSAMTPCPRNPLPTPSPPHFWSQTTVSLLTQLVSSQRSFTHCSNLSMFPWRGMTQSGT